MGLQFSFSEGIVDCFWEFEVEADYAVVLEFWVDFHDCQVELRKMTGMYLRVGQEMGLRWDKDRINGV